MRTVHCAKRVKSVKSLPAFGHFLVLDSWAMPGVLSPLHRHGILQIGTQTVSTAFADSELPRVPKGVRQEFADISAMGTNFPGGDVMHQSLWRKNGADFNLWPKEERFYKGPRLGEYARPLVMNRNVLGYMNQAPVPLSAAEDELTLVAHASSAARRARAHAEYAQQASEKAEAFYKAAKARARALFYPDPPISVKPTADVYPMYSAGPTSISAAVAVLWASQPHTMAVVKGSRSERSRQFLGVSLTVNG